MRVARSQPRKLRWLRPVAVCALLLAGIMSSLLGAITICVCEDGCVCLETNLGAAWSATLDAHHASGPAYVGGCFCDGCTDIALTADKPGKLPKAALHQAATPAVLLADTALAAAPCVRANACRALQPRAPDISLAMVKATRLLL